MTANELDLGYDLTITKVTRHAAGSGTWICGTLHEHRFSALVFPEHAEVADYEIDSAPGCKNEANLDASTDLSILPR